MISEKEFKLLTIINKSSFIKKEDFDADKEFDDACEFARDLLSRGLIHTNSSKPFTKNNTGKGSVYAIAGRFTLSSTASDAVTLADYKTYENLQPKESIWSLENRLKAISIIVALVGVVVVMIYG